LPARSEREAAGYTRDGKRKIMELTTALRARNGAVRFIPKRGVRSRLTATCVLHSICKVLKTKEIMGDKT
jgi:hypothetical protein